MVRVNLQVAEQVNCFPIFGTKEVAQRFAPTVGIGLSREDGRKKLAEWQANNPDTAFRLVHYVPVSWKTVRR